jgi:hypothetical protein
MRFKISRIGALPPAVTIALRRSLHRVREAQGSHDCGCRVLAEHPQWSSVERDCPNCVEVRSS